jgi:5-methylcytosine-specific restriction protein B
MSFKDPTTDELVDAVVKACATCGSRDIVTLWGVPGTGKTHVARLAAEKYAGHTAFVKRIQFHQSYSYEDFIEGLRPTPAGGFDVQAGSFTRWNDQAHVDRDNRYVLLIEELSRANVSAVLGELLTFIEYREEPFETPVSRRQITVAPNLVVLATMNPRDRSAIELDDAVVRRMRVINCPPSRSQLRDVLAKDCDITTGFGKAILQACGALFTECSDRLGDRYTDFMPFGHGMFAGVRSWDDVEHLWQEKIEPLLFRPNIPHDELAEFIRKRYPKKPGPAGDTAAVAPPTGAAASTDTGGGGPQVAR